MSKNKTNQTLINFYKDEEDGGRKVGRELIPSFKELIEKSKTAKELVDNYPCFEFSEGFFNVPIGIVYADRIFKEVNPEKHKEDGLNSKVKRRLSNLFVKAFKNEGNGGVDNNLKAEFKGIVKEWKLIDKTNNLATIEDFDLVYKTATQIVDVCISSKPDKFNLEKRSSFISYIVKFVCNTVRDFIKNTPVEVEVKKDNVNTDKKDKNFNATLLDKIKAMLTDAKKDAEIHIENEDDIVKILKSLKDATEDIVINTGESDIEESVKELVQYAPKVITTKEQHELTPGTVLVSKVVGCELESLLASLKVDSDIVDKIVNEEFVFKNPIRKPDYTILNSHKNYTILSLIFDEAVKINENVSKIKTKPYAYIKDGRLDIPATKQKFIDFITKSEKPNIVKDLFV